MAGTETSRTQPSERRSSRRTSSSPQTILEHPHVFRVGSEEYHAYVLGAERGDGTWAGWLEFVPAGGTRRLRTAQETSQPSLEALTYWATGLEVVYLEGALIRAGG